MDSLSCVVYQVCTEMQRAGLTQHQLQLLKDSLMLHLSHFEISQSANELVEGMSENQRLMKEFLMVKFTEGLSASSLRAYAFALKHFFEDSSDKSAKEIIPNDIRYYIATLKQRNISNATANVRLSYLKSFFGWLHREAYISKNPAAAVSRIKTEKRVKQCLSQLEIEMLINKAKSSRDKAIIATLISTGCRVGEIAKAGRNDVDFEKRELTVIGKGNKERITYLDDRSAYYLSTYLTSREDSCPALFVSQRKSGDRKLSVAGIEVMLKAVGKQCNIQHVHPHKFRRTQATNLLDKGVGIEVIRDVLGHKSIDTTLEYAQVTQSNVKSALKRCGYW